MVKHKRFLKKVSAIAISAIMSFGTFLGGLAPAITVNAATPTGSVADGNIRITCVDSSVHGADRTDSNIQTSMQAPICNLGGYWNSSLTNYNFLYTPEGLATFASRTLEVYDFGTTNTAEAPGRTNYYTDSQLTSDRYVGTVNLTNGIVTITSSTSIGSKTLNELNGHRLVFVEAEVNGYSLSGYYPNTEQANASNKGWQAIVDYDSTKPVDISYNENVASNSAASEPLHNEVYRGGFAFYIWDKELETKTGYNHGDSQGNADLNDAVFAVYNISAASSPTDPRGYVIADLNNNGSIDQSENLTPIPGYTLSTITSAYNSYLSSGANYDNTIDTNGDFILRQNNTAIVPVMLLKPDSTGYVATSDVALPTGNYIVLQIKAGEGYYIDEDFRPIISIGNWISGYNTNQTFKPAFADGEFGISNVYPTALPTVTASGSGRTVQGKISNITSTTSAGNSVVAYCSMGRVTNISSGNQVVVNSANVDTTYAGYSVTHRQSTGTPDRLVPVAAQSRFTCNDTIIRAGGTFRLADCDDVQFDQGSLNRRNGSYIVVPQGNGDFEGSTFVIKPAASMTNDVYQFNGADATLSAISQIPAAGITYTVVNGVLTIPVDELPYGSYTMEQTKWGPGYEDNDLLPTVTTFDIVREDTVTGDSAEGTNLQPYTVNGVTYLPQQLSTGGELVKINCSSDNTDGLRVRVSVYNISDHYVYLDETASGRRETMQSFYNSNIKPNTNLSFARINELVADKTNCLVIDNAEVAINELYTLTQNLPYGTYLTVITSIPDGFELDPNIPGNIPYGPITVDDDPQTPPETFERTIIESAYIPEIETLFIDKVNRIDSIPCENGIVMIDECAISNLRPGSQYRIYGVVVDSEGNIYNGMINSDTFRAYTATSANDIDLDGTANVTMTFTFNSAGVENKVLTVYEYVCKYTAAPNTTAMRATTIADLETALGGNIIGRHTDLTDEDQTARIAGLDIHAEARYTSSKIIDGTEQVQATVTYSGVEAGQDYRIEMRLYDPSNNQIEGCVISKSFTATNTTGVVTGLFEGLDVEEYNGQRLTVYADLYRVFTNDAGKSGERILITKGDADSMGWQPTDPNPGENQVDVLVPTIATVFATTAGQDTNINLDAAVATRDTVHYEDLIVGATYRSVLTVTADGSEVVDKDGKKITATVEFTATDTVMDIEIPVTVNAPGLAGLNLVAFNDLYKVINNKTYLVAFEHDADNTDQTITTTGSAAAITISTVAVDATSRSHTLAAINPAPAIDTVSVRGLEPNTSYVCITEVANASTGVVVNQIAPISNTFTSDANGNATITVNLSINAKVFAGQSVVIYETIYDSTQTTVIGEHKNKDDANQTLRIPSMSTVCTGANGAAKTIELGTAQVIQDVCTYTNLNPGQTYILVSSLVPGGGQGGSGNASNSNGIAQLTQEFTPDQANGSITVRWTVDTTQYAGMQLVATQKVMDAYTNSVVIQHNDMNDLAQTVTIQSANPTSTPNPEDPSNPDNPSDPGTPSSGDPTINTGTGRNIQTGVAENYGLYFILAGVAGLLAIGGVGYVIYDKKKKKA